MGETHDNEDITGEGCGRGVSKTPPSGNPPKQSPHCIVIGRHSIVQTYLMHLC